MASSDDVASAAVSFAMQEMYRPRVLTSLAADVESVLSFLYNTKQETASYHDVVQLLIMQAAAEVAAWKRYNIDYSREATPDTSRLKKAT